jgi:hypothetical protein
LLARTYHLLFIFPVFSYNVKLRSPQSAFLSDFDFDREEPKVPVNDGRLGPDEGAAPWVDVGFLNEQAAGEPDAVFWRIVSRPLPSGCGESARTFAKINNAAKTGEIMTTVECLARVVTHALPAANLLPQKAARDVPIVFWNLRGATSLKSSRYVLFGGQ